MTRFFQQRTLVSQLGIVCCLVLWGCVCLEQAVAKRKSIEANFPRYEALMGAHFTESAEAYHERMSWFREAKRGMVIHLGLYSHLEGTWQGREISGNNTEWIWSRLLSEPQLEFTNQEYLDLVRVWNPEKFDADEVVELAQNLGMSYVTITAKHHEGFCLWPSEFTEFDIDATPMKGRDLLQELANACREAGLRFGVYYSILDWHYALAEARQEGKEWQSLVLGHNSAPQDGAAYTAYMKNQLKEIIERYDVDFVRFDGDWLEGYLTPDRSYDLYEYLRELKPSLILHERCFSRKFPDSPKKDFGTLPNLKPSAEFLQAQQDPQTRKYYEFLLGTQVSWGFDGRQAHMANSQYTSAQRMLECYAILRQVEGNFLLNFGPRKEGSLDARSVQLAQLFAQMADELEKVGFEKKQLRQVVEATRSQADLSSENRNHFKHTHDQAFKRLEKARTFVRQLTQWERWHEQEKKLDRQRVSAVIKQLEALHREAKNNSDPTLIVEQIAHYCDRFKQLL